MMKEKRKRTCWSRKFLSHQMAKDNKTKQESVEETPRKWLVIFYKKYRKFKGQYIVLHEESFLKNVISETLSVTPVPQTSQ